MSTSVVPKHSDRCEVCFQFLSMHDDVVGLLPEEHGAESTGSHRAHALCAETVRGLGSLEAARSAWGSTDKAP